MEHTTAMNGLLTVGAPAPNFRLVSAQGPAITLEEYRGQRNVILWLSRGLFCPFCRWYMTQLRLGYQQIQERGAEILQITWSTLEEARLYFQQY
ncbi:MAG: redoxin domain-containing protein, partial [Candidatus Binatia bacterium]